MKRLVVFCKRRISHWRCSCFLCGGSQPISSCLYRILPGSQSLGSLVPGGNASFNSGHAAHHIYCAGSKLVRQASNVPQKSTLTSRGNHKRIVRERERVWRLCNAASAKQRLAASRVTPLWTAILDSLKDHLSSQDISEQERALREFMARATTASVDDKTLSRGGHALASA
eukprot:TRINITY_DN20705_c0_g2_i1.p1 TRINITY_DN20705_c0_g2~~TRINITY_DN20705_c0_g2_i1.p1  ORF type:complete len:171 (-),score=10.52 TRINITY_DN20705_c0_g2_i1:73-585(-)